MQENIISSHYINMVRECRSRYGRRKKGQENMPFLYIDLLRVNMAQIHLQYCKNNHNFCSIVGTYMLVDSKCRRTSYHHVLYNIYNMVIESVEADMAEHESDKEKIHDRKK